VTGDDSYRDLNLQMWALEDRADLLPQERRAQTKALKDVAKAEMDGIDERVERARREGDAACHKQERYCVEQRALLRHLEDLAASEREMGSQQYSKDNLR